MRICFIIFLLLMSVPISTQYAHAASPDTKPQGVLVRNIAIEGFILGDKAQFVKLFKPYRNKYLSTADMDGILQKIESIYELEGYLQLVSITYHVYKHRLIYTALMIS